jgi:hypothetical protein
MFLMRNAASISAGQRAWVVLADPSTPFVALAGLAVGAVLLGSPLLAWASLAGLAGYSLSGST